MKSNASRLRAFAIGALLSLGCIECVAAAAANEQLEEVIVTASKRSEDLQKVSTSIQVKKGEDLRQTGKQRLDEIMQGTVGIQAQDNAKGLTFFVRGVDASAGQPNTLIASPVAIMVDGVASSRSETVRGDTLDLNQAEIMRGPQTTSVGPNSLSGAVSLVSNDPALGKLDASANIEVGNYSKRALQGMVNLPMGDTFALRLAASVDRRDGYISAGAGDSDLSTVRAKLRWQPRESLDTVFTLQHQKIGGNGVQNNILLAYGQWQKVAGTEPWLSDTGCAAVVPNFNITVMGCPASYYFDSTATQGFRQRTDAWNDGFPANSFPNDPFIVTNVDRYSAKIDWNTSLGTLTILPALERSNYGSREAPRGTSYMELYEDERAESVDAHFNSRAGGKATWQVGAYYNKDEISNNWVAFINYPVGTNGISAGPPGPPGWQWQLQPLLGKTSQSVYGSIKFKVTDRVRLLAAARNTSDRGRASLAATVPGTSAGADPVAAAAAAVNSDSASWSQLTYRAGVEVDVSPDQMAYLNYSTGYTPGNFSVNAPDRMRPGDPLSSKGPATTLKQAAIGWKSEYLNRRLQLNGELFVTTFYNRVIQGTAASYIGSASSANCSGSFPPPPGSFVVGTLANNAGACLILNQDQGIAPRFTSKGLDIDGTWLISGADRLALNAEFLRTQYEQKPVPISGDYSVASVQALAPSLSLADATALSQGMDATLAAFQGASPQNSPETSVNLDYMHTFTFQSGSQLIPHLSAQYKSRYWSFGGAPGANVGQIIADSSNPDNLAWQQAYTRWDAYLQWRSAKGRYSVSGFVKNLGNEVVMRNYTFPYVELDPPRTVGLIFDARL